MITSLYILKRKLTTFFNEVSKCLHSFHEMPKRYQGDDRNPSKCIPTFLLAAVETPSLLFLSVISKSKRCFLDFALLTLELVTYGLRMDVLNLLSKEALIC